ncbi:MAG: biotin carboxylase N-terminal domain-containing protein [Alphaproteobacteria bacterium]
MSFTRLLIANRGEIACRVARTARALGYETVAVYSDADADAPHVAACDVAARIGPAPVGESYLSIPAIIEAAKKTGVDAVHPGYGFLSENADFVAACAEAGLIFVGPPADAVRLMGNKRQAKLRMEAAGVPCVPGYSGEAQDDASLTKEAERIGFPLMIKAAAGGGGRGMRRVDGTGEVADALSSARSEAKNAFGSDELILERAVIAPRHVEVQVFADSRGNAVHLGERDCSIQRRHQKVVEEAPSPAVDADLRARMGEAAVTVAREIGYRGAGTVEFLLSAEGDFYFLEMNTRLQVEHPVTEAITGQDLVAWQLAVAAGEPLPLTQDEISFVGHAIEVRLYAEDAAGGFLPQTGRLALWRPAPDVRTDHGLADGFEVTPFYDPMLAKVIVHGATREEARRRLRRALRRTVALGVLTNRDFLVEVLDDPRFVAGQATTAFIDDFKLKDAAPDAATWALAAALSYGGGRSWGRDGDVVRLAVGEVEKRLSVLAHGGGRFTVDGTEVQLTGDGFEVDGVRRRCAHARVDGLLHLDVDGRSVVVEEKPLYESKASNREADGRLVAPMSGRIVAVRGTVGDAVDKGAIVVVLEAMKMEHEIRAGAAGRIAELVVAEGDQVTPRQLLAVVKADA